MPPLILDGYTMKGKVLTPGWPDLEITYRPATSEKVASWNIYLRSKGAARIDAACDLLNGCLLAWDILDKDGAAVPCTAENWRKLPFPVLDRIENKVTGYDTEGDVKN